MSVVNVFVGDGSVMCLSDTLSYVGRKPAALLRRKCMTYPDAKFAMAGRGCATLIHFVDMELATLRGMDEAVAEMPHILNAPGEDWFSGWGMEGLSIFLMGWSCARDSAVAWYFQRVKEGVEMPQELECGYHLAPGLSPNIAARLRRPATTEIMERVAITQWRIQEELAEPMCIGGVMHLTEIAEKGISQRIIGVYPDYAKHAAAFGDPNTNEVATLTKELAA